MSNVNTRTERVMKGGDIYIPDDLFEKLISGMTKQARFDKETGLILMENSAYKWLAGKLPILNIVMPHQAEQVIKAFLFKYGRHHVCPKCENLLLHHMGTRKCGSCGHEISSTKSVIDYLNDGDYH